MRGKASSGIKDSFSIGITPAYAGKRVVIYPKLPKMQDHPRLCGEKGLCSDKIIFRRGSPPPMRGKDVENKIFSYSNRITPAYAGKRPVHNGIP